MPRYLFIQWKSCDVSLLSIWCILLDKPLSSIYDSMRLFRCEGILAMISLIQHLLSILFEFTTTVHIAQLLISCSTCSVHLWELCWRLLGSRFDYHSSFSHGVFLGSDSITLIISKSFLYWFIGNLWLLSDYIHHWVLQCFFILAKTVLFPSEIHYSCIKVISAHASIKEANTSSIIWILSEVEWSAVLHELFKLGWMTSAKLIQGSLNLLLLDVVVFLILGASWETLPWELALQEIK